MSAIANAPEMSMADRAKLAYLDHIEDEKTRLHRAVITVCTDILGTTDDISELEFDVDQHKAEFKVEGIEFRVTIETVVGTVNERSNHMIAGIHDEEVHKLFAYKAGMWTPINTLADLGKIINKPTFYGVKP